MMSPFLKSLFVVCTVLFCCLFPFSLIAQTVEIEEKEKELNEAWKDTTDNKYYYETLFQLKALYRGYLKSLYEEEGIPLPPFSNLGDSSTDMSVKEVALREIDSLKIWVKKPNYTMGKILYRDQELFPIYNGFNTLGENLSNKGRTNSSFKYYSDVLRMWRRIDDTTTTLFLAMSATFAENLQKNGKPLEAIDIFNNILPQAKAKYKNLSKLKIDPSNLSMSGRSEFFIDFIFASSLYSLAISYNDIGQLDTAKRLLNESITISKDAQELQFEDTTTNRMHHELNDGSFGNLKYKATLCLANIMIKQQKFEEALNLVNQEIKSIENTNKIILEQLFSTKIVIYERTMDFVGYSQTLKEAQNLNLNIEESYKFLVLLGQFKKLEEISNDKLQRLEERYGKESSVYIKELVVQSYVWLLENDYENGIKKLDEAYALSQSETLSSNYNPNIMGAYALVANMIGLKKQALNFRKLSFDEQIKRLDPVSKQMGYELSFLGDAFRSNELFDSAKLYYKKALNIFDKTVGKNDLSYLMTLQSLAYSSFASRDFIEAEKRLNEIFEYGKPYFGQYSPLWELSIYINATSIYGALGKIAIATEYNMKASQIVNLIFQDSNNPFALTIINQTLRLAELEGDSVSVYNKASEWLLGMKHQIDETISFLPDGEKTQFLESFEDDFASIASVLCKDNGYAPLLYNLALLEKGVALSDIRSFQFKVTQITNVNTQNTAYLLLGKMQSLNNDSISTDMRVKYKHDADSLRTQLKKDIPRLFESDRVNTSWQDIQKKLKSNEIAIEFLDFKCQSPTLPTDSTLYYALILRSTGNPEVIPLFEEKALTTLLIENDINTLYKKNGKALSELIWRPLEKAKILRGGETVYYAPSGSLHRIAFAALPNLDGKGLLSDRYQFRTMNSTRDIEAIEDKPLNLTTTTAATFGHIDYTADSTQLVKAYNRLNQKHFEIRLRSYAPTDTICGLNLLEDDTKPIHQLLKQKNIPATLYQKSAASEDAFRLLGTKKAPAPTLIFISTHGSYDETDDKLKLTPQQSLHHNYLLMAGCERQLCQRATAIEGFEDGILTAAEIAQMNLSTTQLVVLAACQTGLGDIKGREGVYGLSRGFKLAGVRYTLASLWEVPDVPTAKYMQCFYTELLSGKTIPAAYAITQKKMREKYPNEPFNWAAWVLTR